jgi:hypothetical protein
VVIDAELGREDHGSIPATAIGRGLEPLGVKTDPRDQIRRSVDRILAVKTKKIQTRLSGSVDPIPILGGEN